MVLPLNLPSWTDILLEFDNAGLWSWIKNSKDYYACCIPQVTQIIIHSLFLHISIQRIIPWDKIRVIIESKEYSVWHSVAVQQVLHSVIFQKAWPLLKGLIQVIRPWWVDVCHFKSLLLFCVSVLSSCPVCMLHVVPHGGAVQLRFVVLIPVVVVDPPSLVSKERSFRICSRHSRFMIMLNLLSHDS